MPPGVRDLLAEYLNPRDPDISGGRLVYEPTTGIAKSIDVVLPIVAEYHAQVAKGNPSQEVAETVGTKHQKSDRTVYRYVDHWKRLAARLGGKA